MSDRVETYDGKGNLLHVQDERDLAEVKNGKWDEINIFRDVVIDRGIWFIGHNWSTDATSRANITGAVAGVVAGITLPTNFTWRDINNNNVPFNSQALVGLAGYTMLYVNEVYNASWTMKGEVDALSNLADVDNYVVSAQAWPTGNMDGTMPVANSGG